MVVVFASLAPITRACVISFTPVMFWIVEGYTKTFPASDDEATPDLKIVITSPEEGAEILEIVQTPEEIVVLAVCSVLLTATLTLVPSVQSPPPLASAVQVPAIEIPVSEEMPVILSGNVPAINPLVTTSLEVAI